MEAPTWLFAVLILTAIGISEALYLPDHEKQETIYDVLQLNGLPIGLLPKGVKNYTVDKEGNFEVHLDKPCYAKFENQVHYNETVKGNLSYGQIGGLSGVAAQELFLWFPVKGIRVDIPSSGLIYFDVGVIYKQFSLSLFETPPDCKEVGVQDKPELIEGKKISDLLSQALSGRIRFERDNALNEAL